MMITSNQDGSCVVFIKDTKFEIFKTGPYILMASSDVGKEIRSVEMLFKCNLLAIILKENSRILHIWNDSTKKFIKSIKTSKPIIRVLLRMDTIVLIMFQRIQVFDFVTCEQRDLIDTYENPMGLGCLCQYSCNKLLVFPHVRKGNIQMERYNTQTSGIIQAHRDNLIEAIALNFEGNRLVTCSDFGRIIRIFDISYLPQYTKLHEMRRGWDCASIYSLRFHETSKWLLVASDTNTVHIFALHGLEEENKEQNQKSYFSSLGKYLKLDYFQSEWSFYKCSVEFIVPYIALFGNEEEDVLIIISDRGQYIKKLFLTK